VGICRLGNSTQEVSRHARQANRPTTTPSRCTDPTASPMSTRLSTFTATPRVPRSTKAPARFTLSGRPTTRWGCVDTRSERRAGVSHTCCWSRLSDGLDLPNYYTATDFLRLRFNQKPSAATLFRSSPPPHPRELVQVKANLLPKSQTNMQTPCRARPFESRSPGESVFG